MSVTRDGLWHIKSPLARTVYNKIQEDSQLKTQDHSCWYAVKLNRIEDEDLREKFIQFEEDMETTKFLTNCYEKSDWIATQMYHRLMKSVLSWFMTSTSINGWLGRGSMFVFSSLQFRSLMNINEEWKGDKMLDLGAGDGEVTKRMSSHYAEVHTTEMSVTMVQRLEESGFKVLGIEEWPSHAETYDLVSCLNLLDRCEQPITMLHQMKRVLHPTRGRLLLAIVLPFSPYFEYGGSNHQPEQNLIVMGKTFEEQLSSFVNTVIIPAGFKVVSFSRVPYLCEGDLEHSFYVLNDAIFLLQPV